ncbi:MAG: hypothetical protein U9Q03_00865 [Patescibacteria group bacterium]|nr:hypothetical protein [Patescibacteria group bacterium]
MDLPESRTLGRINGIRFEAMWHMNPQTAGTVTPGIGLFWNTHTDPDKFAALADQTIDEYIESLDEDEHLDPFKDGDAIIGTYRLMCSLGELSMEYVEGARRQQEGRPLERLLRNLLSGRTLGTILSSSVSTASFHMFTATESNDGPAESHILINVEEFEAVLQLPSVVSWVRVSHPDVDSDCFRQMIPGVIEQALKYFNETEVQVTG